MSYGIDTDLLAGEISIKFTVPLSLTVISTLFSLGALDVVVAVVGKSEVVVKSSVDAVVGKYEGVGKSVVDAVVGKSENVVKSSVDAVVGK